MLCQQLCLLESTVSSFARRAYCGYNYSSRKVSPSAVCGWQVAFNDGRGYHRRWGRARRPAYAHTHVSGGRSPSNRCRLKHGRHSKYNRAAAPTLHQMVDLSNAWCWLIMPLIRALASTQHPVTTVQLARDRGIGSIEEEVTTFSRRTRLHGLYTSFVVSTRLRRTAQQNMSCNLIQPMSCLC